MKKYLLLALLAMGATAFGAAGGTSETTAELPIRAKGEIIEAGKGIIIESTTAGMAGNVMEFNFGTLVKPSGTTKYIAEPGSFVIKRADGSALVDEGKTTYTALGVGIGKNANDVSGESSNNEARTGVSVNYSLRGDGTDVVEGATEYRGYVDATLTLENTAEKGSFIESANRVYVKVTKS